MAETAQRVRVDGHTLSLSDVVAVAREGRATTLDDRAHSRMTASWEWVKQAASGQIRDRAGDSLPVYGVNTGYGSLARVRIPGSEIEALSWNLIRSHAAGVGPRLPDDVVRAMMLLRANALAKGASGCRPVVVERLLAMLERGVLPVVPSRGSCGSSGDLAPLAHLGLVLFGTAQDSGLATFAGEVLTGAEAMQRAGFDPLRPGPKEGLAMTNGAQLCTALAALACWDADALVRHAEIAAAMSWEALHGVSRALHPRIHALRPYRGAIACAANLRRLLAGSELVDSVPEKVQDAYSLRCTPQVVGAVRDGIRYATEQVEIELNAATDNPLILLSEDPEVDSDPNRAFSAGLFHGEPIGMAADHLKLALCELGAISERRIFRLTTKSLSGRLPALLVRENEFGMGQMVPQTTAAALVSENRSLAWPNTADSIPTCEDQEDLVAMSTAAARRAAEVLRNCQRVIAIETMVAATGIEWRRRHAPHLSLGAGTRVAFEHVVKLLSSPTPGESMERIDALVSSGDLLKSVESAIGPLERTNG